MGGGSTCADGRGCQGDGRGAVERPAGRINLGRGAIVKLDALVTCLREGAIAGAALDVYEAEPLPAGHPLWDMENVILTPHIAGNCTLIAHRHLAVVTENLSRFLSGAPLQNVVRKADWF